MEYILIGWLSMMLTLTIFMWNNTIAYNNKVNKVDKDIKDTLFSMNWIMIVQPIKTFVFLLLMFATLLTSGIMFFYIKNPTFIMRIAGFVFITLAVTLFLCLVYAYIWAPKKIKSIQVDKSIVDALLSKAENCNKDGVSTLVNKIKENKNVNMNLMKLAYLIH